MRCVLKVDCGDGDDCYKLLDICERVFDGVGGYNGGVMFGFECY